jgi:deazaflavin-dependent oxidoreductase (nitroreductase family)
MGLSSDLSYRFTPANPFQRMMQALVSSRPGAWLFSRLLPTLDTVVGKLSGGRTSVPALLAGLPVLDVTTTGRKSGLRRTTHLLSVPVGEDLALLGTNFGQPATPGWVFNLEADPQAEVTFKNRTLPVVARPASEAERDEVMRLAAGIYGGYAKYQTRISGRTVRIFVLEPVA